MPSRPVLLPQLTAILYSSLSRKRKVYSVNKHFRIISHRINTEITYQILPAVSPSCGSWARKSVVTELSYTRSWSLSTVYLHRTGRIDAWEVIRCVKTRGYSDKCNRRQAPSSPYVITWSSTAFCGTRFCNVCQFENIFSRICGRVLRMLDEPDVTMVTKSFANTTNFHIWKLETSVRGVEGCFIITRLTGLSVAFLTNFPSSVQRKC
jgi:hypothetical protein